MFGVKLKGSKWIGNVRLFNWSEIHKRAELSFLFYDKEEWGKGFAEEAILKILSFVRTEFKLHRITADYYACNYASKRLFEKLGFADEGTFKDHFWFEDHFVNSSRVGKIFEK